MGLRSIIIVLLLLSKFCTAQNTKVKTVVFKIKAPLATANIECSDQVFYLEKESNLTIVVKGRNAKIKVNVIGGEIRSVKNNVYKIRLTQIGTAVIKVFQIIPTGTKLIGIRKFEIKPPTIYFCGLKVDSSSKTLRLGKCQMYAYSECFKKNLPIDKFTMIYFEPPNRNVRKKAVIDTLKSETCKMTDAMRTRVLNFQPKASKIYFYNLLCSVPDGSFRLLEPIELFATLDTVINNYSAIYTLKKKKID